MNNKLYGNLIFELSKPGRCGYTLPKTDYKHTTAELPAALCRQKEAELPECDELTVVRHYTNLSHNNFGVNDGFYPLGSCTMKYNPVINEEIAAMRTFVGLHPLQHADTCQHALELYYVLQMSLAELTGLSEFTLNPCAGAHGELTGLMVIRAYHMSRQDEKRTKVLIPDSAHGTNPASAAVCGLDVVEVKSLPDGTVDVDDLKRIYADDGQLGKLAEFINDVPNAPRLEKSEMEQLAFDADFVGGNGECPRRHHDDFRLRLGWRRRKRRLCQSGRRVHRRRRGNRKSDRRRVWPHRQRRPARHERHV